jgi:hypothetical protein
MEVNGWRLMGYDICTNDKLLHVIILGLLETSSLWMMGSAPDAQLTSFETRGSRNEFNALGYRIKDFALTYT